MLNKKKHYVKNPYSFDVIHPYTPTIGGRLFFYPYPPSSDGSTRYTNFGGSICFYVWFRAPMGPGNMILQRSRNSRMVVWKGKLTGQGGRSVWQRQSRARADRDSWSCLDWLGRTKIWPHALQRQLGPCLVWEQDLIEIDQIYIWWCILFTEKYKLNRIKI